MGASDELFHLVHSLSKNEKRYFRRFIHQYSDKRGNNYLQLFEAVQKQSSYDQDKLLHKFRNDDFVKHFSSAKSYLYKIILKSLRAYRAEKNTLIQIRDLQTDAEILQEKGLYLQALKQIRKAKKLGEHYELHLPLLEILQKEKWLIKKVWKKSAEQESEAIIRTINQSFDHLVREVKYGVMFDRFYYVQEKMDAQADLNEQLERILGTTSDDQKVGSFQSIHLELQIKAFYYHLHGETEAIHRCLIQTREHWEAHPQMISLYPGKYKLILRNCLQEHSYQGKEDLFEDLVSKIESLPESAPETELSIQKSLLFTQLLYYLNTGKFEKGIELAPRIRAFLDRFQQQLPDLWILSFSYNLCLVHFMSGHSREALNWANAVINYEKSEVRINVQYGARLLRLLIHYDLGNYDLLEYLLRSTLDYCRKDMGYKALAAPIAQCLRKLLATAVPSPGLFENSMEEIRAENDCKKLQGTQETLIWLESKKENRSITEIARAGTAGTINEAQ